MTVVELTRQQDAEVERLADRHGAVAVDPRRGYVLADVGETLRRLIREDGTTSYVASAWDLIGFDGRLDDVYGLAEDEALDRPYHVRVLGGRALYEAVLVVDGGSSPRLARLEAGPRGLRQVDRYVDPDALLELVEDER